MRWYANSLAGSCSAITPRNYEAIQVEHLCSVTDERLLLRGLCISDVPLARNSRLLIVMEKLNQRFECPDANISPFSVH